MIATVPGRRARSATVPRRLFGGTAPGINALGVWALLTVSAVAVWLVVFAYLLSPLLEWHLQALARSTVRQRLADGTLPVTEPIRAGSPIGQIRIPALGLTKVVVEGTTAGELEVGPGHRRDTVLPGQAGISVLMGRSALFGAPFAGITRLRPGDAIDVATGLGTAHYRTSDVRRPDDRLPPPLQPGQGRLTLETSESSGHGLSAARRLVFVDATLEGPAQPPIAHRPLIAADEQPMAGEALGAMTTLTLWLAGFLAALVAAGWALVHWGRRQTALVAIPVLAALLWGSAQTAMRLLPNLM